MKKLLLTLMFAATAVSAQPNDTDVTILTKQEAILCKIDTSVMDHDVARLVELDLTARMAGVGEVPNSLTDVSLEVAEDLSKVYSSLATAVVTYQKLIIKLIEKQHAIMDRCYNKGVSMGVFNTVCEETSSWCESFDTNK